MKNTFLGICLLGLIAFAACRDNQANKKVPDLSADSIGTEADARFVAAIGESNLMGEQLGKLALSNTLSRPVVQLGRDMIEYYSNLNTELGGLVQSKSMGLPEVLNKEDQGKYEELLLKGSVDFDRAYLLFLAGRLEQEHNAFKNEIERGQDHNIRQWASAKLPLLERQMAMVQSMQLSSDDKP